MRSFAAAHNQYLSPPDEPVICECCGRDDGSCICPECNICGSVGDPWCYQVVDVEGIDFDIRTGVTPNPAKGYKRRRCAKTIMAEVPAMTYNREQLIGQNELKIAQLEMEIAQLEMGIIDHRRDIDHLRNMSDQEIEEMQK